LNTVLGGFVYLASEFVMSLDRPSAITLLAALEGCTGSLPHRLASYMVPAWSISKWETVALAYGSELD
jgi:hypothetical protein